MLVQVQTVAPLVSVKWICVKLAHEVTETKHADVMELVDMRDLGSRA